MSIFSRSSNLYRGTSSYYRIEDDIIEPLCALICDKLDRDQDAVASGSRISS